MAFIDELKDRAADLAQAGMAKSKQLMEITKLSLNNSGEEDAIRKAYLEIGKLYYAEQGSAPDPAYAALCQRITAARHTIEENKARIAQLKQEGVLSDEDIIEATAEVHDVDTAEPGQVQDVDETEE